MKQLCFETNSKYEVIICDTLFDLLSKDAAFIMESACGSRRVYIITDSNTAKLHLETVIKMLSTYHIAACPIVIPAGEEAKSMEGYSKVCSELLSFGCGRNDCILNLGGGMVGDLGGFVAATYMRGIRYINMPTTLISMVDSSMGGKTGIDFNGSKNILGAFHAPSAVLICTDFLKTLPQREFRSGMGEIIKYAAIDGESVLDGVQSSFSIGEELIFRCCQIKREYVCGDEFDNGKRRILNLGHTFGHAFEAASDFSLSHGEAVGLGLLAVTEFGEKLGITDASVSQKVKKLVKRFDMATDYQSYARAAYEHIKHDKKLSGEMLDMVFIKNFGLPIRQNIPISAVDNFLQDG
ncbi:MAG: 3-dehydroquinate synthase [Christensenellaceae bacterium]|nr:3-dehydroquinate synthase [Christensenellaceae bacterium]